MNQKEIFNLMFFALDKCTRTNPTDALLSFCGDVDPFLFTDRTSADPAVSDDFDKFFQKTVPGQTLGVQESLAFVKAFLESIQEYTYSWPKVKAAIESVSEDDWAEAAEKMRSLPRGVNPFDGMDHLPLRDAF
ncbi:MAG: hypothetical protein ACI4UF_11265 [Thermoguttaceae bacterium]